MNQTKRSSCRATAVVASTAIVVGATLGLLACRDDPSNGPLQPQAEGWSCQDRGERPPLGATPCGPTERFVKGECAEARCDAGEMAPNCCPGMLTCTRGGTCQIPSYFFQTCRRDADCGQDQQCLERPRITDELTCGFPRVATDGSCPDGAAPFNQRCVPRAPCGGACNSGLVCNIDTNRCEPAPTLRGNTHGCAVTCGAGELLVYSDPDNMLFEGCCEVSCTCATLPPLKAGVWGSHSDLAIGEKYLYASAYDATYGDLVVSTHDLVSGQLEHMAYVDGVPTRQPVLADPTGLRGGIVAPGDKVGQFSAIAVHDGGLRVVYYDASATRLKLARKEADSKPWQVSVIDEANAGDIGRYSSLAIDDTGRIHVSYFAHRVIIDEQPVTTPMYARSRSPHPNSSADWDHVAVEPLMSCEAPCAERTVCVQSEAGVPECLPRGTGCPASCACDLACVSTDAGATCRPWLPDNLVTPCEAGSCSVGGLPQGVGLFTSLALHEGAPIMVYYDRVRRHLRAATPNFSATSDTVKAGFHARTLVCDATHDLGQHASLAISPQGVIGIAMQGHGGEDLWHYESDALRQGALQRVDNGLRTRSKHLVGGSASLAYDSAGSPYIAYADQTFNDLLLTQRRNNTWEAPKIVLSDGAYGSFARLVVTSDVAYVSTYKRGRDHLGRDQGKLVIQVVPLQTISDLVTASD